VETKSGVILVLPKAVKWAVGLILLGVGGMPSRLSAQGVDPPGKTSSPLSRPAYVEVRSVLSGAVEQTVKPDRIVNYGLKYDDFDRIMANVTTVTKTLPIRELSKEVRHLKHSIDGRVVGTTHEYAGFHGLEMERGRFLTEADNAKVENHAVVGSAVARALYPEEDPVGQSVKLGAGYYTVVGVVKERANPSGIRGGSKSEDANENVYIPLTTCKLRLGERIVHSRPGAPRDEESQLSRLILEVRDSADVEATATLLRSTLKPFHPKGDVEVVILRSHHKTQ
jgi:putative ABC transport system permease protein